MRRIIHRLRQHPEHVRRKILYVATIASFFLLLAAWSFSINTTVNTTDNMQASLTGDLKPFQMLKASIVDSTEKLAWPFNKSTTVNNTNAITVDTSAMTTPPTTVIPETSTTTDTTNLDSTTTENPGMYNSDTTGTPQ